MSETLTSSDLLSKLKKRKEEELRQIESIERDALKSLASSLRSYTENELNTIEAAIRERRRQIENDSGAMSEAIEQSLNKTRSEAIKQTKALRKELIQEIDRIRAEAIDSGPKVWLWRLITPVVMIGALAGGTWGLSAYLSAQITSQIRQLEQLKAEAKQQKATMSKYVVRSWNNAIELSKKPRLWQTKSGTWIVQFEKGQ